MRAKYHNGPESGVLADSDERPQGRRERNGESGFSLLEVSVAAVLTVGLMAVVFSLANRNQRVFVTESGVVEMNQSIRTAIDMLTRDIQQAGVGLPVANGNLAAIYCRNGASGAPDSLMMLNGDPFAPVAGVDSRDAGASAIYLNFPADVISSGSASDKQFSYKYVDAAAAEQTRPIYKAFSSDARRYVVYDDLNARIFSLSQNGSLEASGDIKLKYSSALSPPSIQGTSLNATEPTYAASNVKVLDSTVGYTLNTQTGELLRTENMTDWFPITRGIINLQIQYRIIMRNPLTNAIQEVVVNNPGVDSTPAPNSTLTSRKNIRALIITIDAETPDVPPGNPSYRRVTHRFEVAPRNLNLINNTVPL